MWTNLTAFGETDCPPGHISHDAALGFSGGISNSAVGLDFGTVLLLVAGLVLYLVKRCLTTDQR